MVASDGLNYVWSSIFDRSKPKTRCSGSITNRWTRSSIFDVLKKWCSSLLDEWFSKCEDLLGSMFDVHSFEAKIQVFKFNRWRRSFDVRCSKNDIWVRSMVDKMMLCLLYSGFGLTCLIRNILVWCSQFCKNPSGLGCVFRFSRFWAWNSKVLSRSIL